MPAKRSHSRSTLPNSSCSIRAPTWSRPRAARDRERIKCCNSCCIRIIRCIHWGMSNVIHRSLRGTPLTAASAQGLTITDSEGRRYLDASGGAAVSCLGHGHPDVLAAMHAQLDRLAYAHTSFFTSEVSEALASHLARHAPPGLDQVYFVSGGSEAVEAALKLARQYFVEIGQPQRTQFVARRQSYHGNTLGALAVGGNE